MTTTTIAQQIRTAYATIADAPGEWVSLATLRRHLRMVDAALLDHALKAMDGNGATLIPEAIESTLTAEQRDAAVVIGDEAQHLIAIY